MEARIHIYQRVDARKRRVADIHMSNIRFSRVSLLWDAQLSAWIPSLSYISKQSIGQHSIRCLRVGRDGRGMLSNRTE